MEYPPLSIHLPPPSGMAKWGWGAIALAPHCWGGTPKPFKRFSQKPEVLVEGLQQRLCVTFPQFRRVPGALQQSLLDFAKSRSPCLKTPATGGLLWGAPTSSLTLGPQACRCLSHTMPTRSLGIKWNRGQRNSGGDEKGRFKGPFPMGARRSPGGAQDVGRFHFSWYSIINDSVFICLYCIFV